MAGKQRIAGGYIFPVYVNETNSYDSNAVGIFINQVSAALAHLLTLMGVGT